MQKCSSPLETKVLARAKSRGVTQSARTVEWLTAVHLLAGGAMMVCCSEFPELPNCECLTG